MKRGTRFFREPKPKTRVQCHVDGVTIPGLGSMRLSNIPKNLLNMGRILLTAGKKAQSLLCYGVALGVVTVQADDCQSSLNSTQNYRNLFFNNLQNTSSLWFQYDPTYILTPSNVICNLSVTKQKSGNYSLLDCFCLETEFNKQVNGIVLYGSNLSNEMINCLSQLINNNCPKSNNIPGYLAIAFIIPIIFMWVYCYCCLDKDLKCKRAEEKNIIFSSINESKLTSLPNPILDDYNLDQQEPQNENRSWCCFGK